MPAVQIPISTVGYGMVSRRTILAVLAAMASVAAAGPAGAQLLRNITQPSPPPGRLPEDAAKDREVVDLVMAALNEANAVSPAAISFEQRTVAIGIVTDRAAYDKVQDRIRAIRQIDKLYWHVSNIPGEALEKTRDRLLTPEAIAARVAEAQARLDATPDLPQGMITVGGDAFGAVYLVGRLGTREDRERVADIVRGDSARRVIPYILVPKK